MVRLGMRLEGKASRISWWIPYTHEQKKRAQDDSKGAQDDSKGAQDDSKGFGQEHLVSGERV